MRTPCAFFGGACFCLDPRSHPQRLPLDHSHHFSARRLCLVGACSAVEWTSVLTPASSFPSSRGRRTHLQEISEPLSLSISVQYGLCLDCCTEPESPLMAEDLRGDIMERARVVVDPVNSREKLEWQECSLKESEAVPAAMSRWSRPLMMASAVEKSSAGPGLLSG